MGTVILISERGDLHCAEHVLKQSAYRRIRASVQSEVEKLLPMSRSDLKKERGRLNALRLPKFLLAHTPQEAGAHCIGHSTHWAIPYFLVILSRQGMDLARQFGHQVGFQDIADLAIVLQTDESPSPATRDAHGVLTAVGLIENPIVKNPIVDAIVQFSTEEIRPRLRLNTSSAYPPDLSITVTV